MACRDDDGAGAVYRNAAHPGSAGQAACTGRGSEGTGERAWFITPAGMSRTSFIVTAGSAACSGSPRGCVCWFF
ncbi:MAG: hypothetical protein WCE46_08730 [Methanoregula sp.]|uniref:hypothetical protein n=1 Tax=Methanoregula sp. TaxID=2052170 RepID=UPI003C77B22E